MNVTADQTLIEEGASDIDDDETFFQDIDILQSHGIVRLRILGNS